MSELIKWQYKRLAIVDTPANKDQDGLYVLENISTVTASNFGGRIRSADDLGKYGWELVAIQDDCAYFKRSIMPTSLGG